MYRRPTTWNRLSADRKSFYIEVIKAKGMVLDVHCKCCQCWNCHGTNTSELHITFVRQGERSPELYRERCLYCTDCGFPKWNRDHWYGDSHSRTCEYRHELIPPETWGINV